MKICTKCKFNKDLINFAKCAANKDGYQSMCNNCKKVYNKAWRLLNNDHCLNYSRGHYNNNKKQKNEYSKIYQNRNKDKQILYSKKYRSSLKGIVKRKKYRKKEYDLKYNIDIEWTLKIVLRNRLKNAIKNNFQKGKTIELLGCSIFDFKIYLENRFNKYMSWENYGKGKYWEIDHIIPCDYFDLTNIEEQQKCFHYSNMQPLSIIDNRIKNNKYE